MKFIRDIINEKKQAALLADPGMADVTLPAGMEAPEPPQIPTKVTMRRVLETDEIRTAPAERMVRGRLLEEPEDTPPELNDMGLFDEADEPGDEVESLFDAFDEAEEAEGPAPDDLAYAVANDDAWDEEEVSEDEADAPDVASAYAPEPVEMDAAPDMDAPDTGDTFDGAEEVLAADLEDAALETEPAPQAYVEPAPELEAPAEVPGLGSAVPSVAQDAELARHLLNRATQATAAVAPAAPSMPAAPAEPQAVEVPAPAGGRASRRAGRVKTRILGFTPPDAGADPFASDAASGTSSCQFPVGWLAVVDGPGRGATYALFNGVSQIGRGEGQGVRLDFGDNSISRENHAAVAYDVEARQFFLGHGGKANLVRLNDRPVLSTETLQSGDRIRIGETTLHFIGLCGKDFDWSEGQGNDAPHS